MLRRILMGLLAVSMCSAPAYAKREIQLDDVGHKVILGTTSGLVKVKTDEGLLAMRHPGVTDSYIRIRTNLEDSASNPGASAWYGVKLPNSNWTFTGSKYIYNDPSGTTGGVSRIVWKSRKLTIKLKGAGYNPPMGPVSFLEIRFSVHDKTFCARFENFSVNQAGNIRAVNSVACDPLPPTFTPTFTVTNTPTNTHTYTQTYTPTRTPTNTIPFTPTRTPTITPTPTLRPYIDITSPAHGLFTGTASSIGVAGKVYNLSSIPFSANVTLNGSPISVNPVTGDFSTTVAISEFIGGDTTKPKVFNPLVAELYVPATGYAARDRHVVISGNSLVDAPCLTNPSTRNPAACATRSIGLRITDPGFNAIEPIITSLVNLDPSTLITPGTRLINNYEAGWPACNVHADLTCLDMYLDCANDSGCSAIPHSKCQFVTRTFKVPNSNKQCTSVYQTRKICVPSFGLDIDSLVNQVNAVIKLGGLKVFVHVFPSGSGPFGCFISPNCYVYVPISITTLNGNYGLQRYAPSLTNVDVYQIGSVDATLGGLSPQTVCTSGEFLGLVADQINSAIRDKIEPELEGFLNTADSNGNTPIAGAVEGALQAVEISGPIGGALGVNLETPFSETSTDGVNEDNNGITLITDSGVTSIPPVPPGAPNFVASYYYPQTFPTFGTTTPLLGRSYHLGLCLSAGAFNQLLKAMVEEGLLTSDLTEIDLGTGPMPITVDLLDDFLPELAVFPPETRMIIKLRPTLAPIVTNVSGPNGELADLRINHLEMSLAACNNPSCTSDTLVLKGAVDARVGTNLTFNEATGGLDFQLTPPEVQDIQITILENPYLFNEALISIILPEVVAPMVPSLASALGSFPVPSFFGLTACGVEVSRQSGGFMSVFLNLTSGTCP